jgi:hypothetical protein
VISFAHDPYNTKADNRKASLSTLYRTHCSICRLGVYAGQRTVWTRGQHLGTSHKECADQLRQSAGRPVR